MQTRSDNSVPSFGVEATSEEIMLAQLKEAFRLNRLRREYGQFFRQRNGRKFLNERFWAAWLCVTLRVYFDETIGSFRYAYLSSAAWNSILCEGLIEAAGVALLQAADASTQGFPFHEIQPERIRQLIEVMKSVPKSESVSKGPPVLE
jgi:hypothetical protein